MFKFTEIQIYRSTKFTHVQIYSFVPHYPIFSRSVTIIKKLMTPTDPGRTFFVHAHSSTDKTSNKKSKELVTTHYDQFYLTSVKFSCISR